MSGHRDCERVGEHVCTEHEARTVALKLRAELDAAREELCERTHELATLKYSNASDWIALRAELDAARAELARMTERSKSYEQAWLDAAACREDARAEAARFRAALEATTTAVNEVAQEQHSAGNLRISAVAFVNAVRARAGLDLGDA